MSTNEEKIKLLSYDMNSMRERWLRVENKYDKIYEELNKSRIKNNLTLVLLGVILAIQWYSF
tara:strand:+ start:161 stop:346 length:186 start_codon:yes stop_codon:yes gene_type:complete